MTCPFPPPKRGELLAMPVAISCPSLAFLEEGDTHSSSDAPMPDINGPPSPLAAGLRHEAAIGKEPCALPCAQLQPLPAIARVLRDRVVAEAEAAEKSCIAQLQ